MKERFRYHLFANDTWVVVGNKSNKELCVVGAYEGETKSAEDRAQFITNALNFLAHFDEIRGDSQ